MYLFALRFNSRAVNRLPSCSETALPKEASVRLLELSHSPPGVGRIPMKRSIALALTVLCGLAFGQERKKRTQPDDQQAEREAWFYGQRAYPNGSIPAGARIKALAEIDRIDTELRARAVGPLAAASTLTTAGWTSIGPQPTDPGTQFVTAGR